MESNIVPINPRLEYAKRIRASASAQERSAEQWVEDTLRLASDLWQARQDFPGDREFGQWLMESGMDEFRNVIVKDERAALIKMAQHPDDSRQGLMENNSRSPRYAWETFIAPRIEKKNVLSQNCESKSTSTSSPEAPEIGPTAAIPEEPTAESRAGTDRATPPAKKSVRADSRLHGLPRAEEVAAIYLHANARHYIGRAVSARGGRAIWDLIVQALDGGLLKPTSAEYEAVSLRLLLPGIPPAYSRRFDLTSPADRAKVRDVILPAAIANRDAILANPQDAQMIVEGHLRRQDESRRQESERRRVETEIQRMPPDEMEVFMYGVRLWPRPAGELYDYRELRSGIWWFRDLNRWLQGTMDSEPASRALKMRHLVNWPHQFARHELKPEALAKIEKLVGVVHKLSRLLEANPDSDEQTWKFPPEPNREDEKW